MADTINLHKLAECVGWVPLYVDEGYISYEYQRTIKNIESLCHILKLYDDLDYDNYYSTFETIIGVLPKKLIRKIKKITKKCDKETINNILDLACYEIDEYKQKTIYNKLFVYGNLVGINIDDKGYKFCYSMSKATERKILSLIESSLSIDLAPILGKLKKIDYKIGYIKQNGLIVKK